MKKLFQKLNGNFSVDYTELKGFTRSVAELQWLLLAVTLLYSLMPGSIVDSHWGLLFALLIYTGYILGTRYINFYHKESTFKLILDTWMMIFFITLVLWYTGKTDSPLLNLYLIVVVTSALTLGKFMTFVQLLLITGCVLYLEYAGFPGSAVSFESLSLMLAKLSPIIVVTYLTTMLSADLQYAKSLFMQQSEVDDLTGLMNEKGFKRLLEQEGRKAIRYSRPFSIMLFDTDDLKSVNDEFGHESGNMLIRAVGEKIENCMRDTDVVARYRGDQFIMLLPETPNTNAQEAAERIREGIEQSSFNVGVDHATTTVSIGIASYPEDAGDMKNLLECADVALHKSKQAGRNTVTLHSFERTQKLSSIPS